MIEQTQEQVEQTLRDSGLWSKICPSCNGKGHTFETDEFGMGGTDVKCNQYYCDGLGVYFKAPDADQSEAILANMGLQVVWAETSINTDQWVIASMPKYTVREYEPYHLYEFLSVLDSMRFYKKGQRTLANNAALTWCGDNMRADLELAINTINITA